MFHRATLPFSLPLSPLFPSLPSINKYLMRMYYVPLHAKQRSKRRGDSSNQNISEPLPSKKLTFQRQKLI